MVDHAKKRMHDPTTLPALTHIETCIDQVQHWIIYGGWTPSEPIHTQHYEPSNGKLRDIDYVPYWPDGVMHWVLIEAIYDVVVPKMDPYCIAGIKGRGPHSAAKQVARWMKTDRAGMKYGAELDIHHCFPESDHDFIEYGYRQLIKDKYWLRMADAVVDSFPNGLPIGYVTSHWFQNLAMTAFDRYVRGLDGVEHYYRYADNVHLYGPNKRKLHRALEAAMEWLAAADYLLAGLPHRLHRRRRQAPRPRPRWAGFCDLLRPHDLPQAHHAAADPAVSQHQGPPAWCADAASSQAGRVSHRPAETR